MKPPAPDRFLVTGCASGIGRRLAADLLSRGHRVLATDVDLGMLRTHAAAWPAERCRVERLDVRDPAEWARAVAIAEAQWQGLDVLLSVAGYLRPAEVRDTTDEDVDRHLDVNVKGVVHGTRVAARLMTRQGWGHIVNVASLASLAPIPGIALYSASKYAVRAFSLAAAEELRPHGVAVTVVCPDAVATPMLDRQLDFPEAAFTFTASRILTVEEISRWILGPVLKRRPLLVARPLRRAWLARFADLFPASAKPLAAVMRRRGMRRQEALRQALRKRS